MEDIGIRIGELIEQSGLTNAEFADRIGTSSATISHILKGRNKPSLQIVLQIKEVFTNVNMDYILTGKGQLLIPEKPSFVESDLPVSNEGFTTFPIEGVRKVNVSGAPVDNSDKGKVESEAKSNIVADEVLPKSLPNTDSKLVKVLLLYSDGHFEVFKP